MSAEDREKTAYRWARRVLIAIGAIGIVGALALAIGIALISWDGPRFEPAKVESADRQRGFTIGDVAAIDGTRFVRMNVSASEGSSGSFSYSRNDLRNVMILDGDNGRSWRLMPNNDRRIASTSWFPAAATGPSDEAGLDLSMAVAMDDAAPANRPRAIPPDAYFAFIVDRGDGTRDLVTGTIDGQRRGMPMTGIDGLDSSWMRNADHLAAIVRERGRLFYRIVDMTTFRTVSSRPMPIGQ